MSGELWMVLVAVGVLVLATAAVTVFLAVRLVRMRGLLTEAGVPVSNKLAFWGAMVYVVSPVDLMPDPILIDDIGVLLLALRSLHGAAEAVGVTLRRGKKDQAPALAQPLAASRRAGRSSARPEKSRLRKSARREA